MEFKHGLQKSPEWFPLFIADRACGLLNITHLVSEETLYMKKDAKCIDVKSTKK